MKSRIAKTAIMFLLCALLPVMSYAGSTGKIVGKVVERKTIL